MPTFATTTDGHQMTVVNGSMETRRVADARVVTYTGSLMVDGVQVRSPDQLHSLWTTLALDYAQLATATERDPDQREHYAARARYVAYTTGVSLIEACERNLTDLVEALGILKRDVDTRLAGAEDLIGTPHGARFREVADLTLARMIDMAETGAPYRWIEG